MKRNVKITIAALCAMFFMAMAVSVISFSRASKSGADATFTDATQLVFADAADDYTNVDNIIMNSHATGTDANPVYRIVEIGSSKTKSNFSDYVEARKAFEEYVLNGHSTKNDTMTPDCIEYKYFCASDITNDSTDDLAYIENADFYYITNDGDEPYYKAGNEVYSRSHDFSEKLFDVLHKAATTYYKPVVIDSPNATTVPSGPNPSAGLTMKNLGTDYFGPSGKYYYTFGWGSQSLIDFFQHKNGSLYLGVNGDKAVKRGYWTKLYNSADLTVDGYETYNMSKMLVVSSAGDTTMSSAILADAQLVPTTNSGLYDQDGNETTDNNIYQIKNISGSDTLLASYGYNARGISPEYIQVENVSMSDLLADKTVKNFDEYDIIVIEADCNSVAIDDDLLNKFIAAMYGKITIIYNASMASAGGSGDDLTSDIMFNESKYVELYGLVVSSNGTAKFSNIMPTTRKQFNVIATSSSVATADVIADLINASSFRGIGGPGGAGASASKFTVLELQPCYPIDRELAKIQGTKIARDQNYFPSNFDVSTGSTVNDSGNYYLRPADMINNKSKEQVPDGEEYYAWELSEAKIANMLGMDVNQINIVHMSSEEMAASKSEIFGKYDLIYIGGNNSALKEATEWRWSSIIAGWDKSSTAASILGTSKINNLVKLPIYTMYSHNGDLVKVVLGHITSSGSNNITDTTPAGVITGDEIPGVVYSEWGSSSMAMLNGNDISYNSMLSLKNYVKKGMPVIVSSKLSAAYNLLKTKGYDQNSIDPDSNMAKLLVECDNSTLNNVLWDFKEDAVVNIDNDGGRLGDTLTGFVSVFANSTGSYDSTDFELTNKVTGSADLASNLYASCVKRPKITLTAKPKTYSLYDDSSKITNGMLSYEYRVTGSSKYTVSLYIDDNNNGKFDKATADDSGEFMTSGSADKLTYKLANDFYGPVYWMIEVVDNVSKLSTYTTGFSYVAPKINDPELVRILQILPGEKGGTLGQGAQGANSLYFCVDCQQSWSILKNNGSFAPGDSYETRYYDGGYKSGPASNGKHEHRFGITTFDSGLADPGATNAAEMFGVDDFKSNLADDVSSMFTFDIDILTRGEYEEWSTLVASAYEYTGTNEQKAMIAKLDAEITTLSEKIANAEDLTGLEDEVELLNLYSLLLTDEQKYTYLMTIEYKKQYDYYYDLYEYMVSAQTSDRADDTNNVIPMTRHDAEEALKTALNDWLTSTADSSIKYSTVHEEVNKVLKSKVYTDLYSISGYMGGFDFSILDAYVAAKDLELHFKENYKMYERYVEGADWLKGCYDCVVIGASDDFAGDDITNPQALADLKNYIDSNGNTILFHDTLTAFKNDGSCELTKVLRASFGLDRYHMEVDSKRASVDTRYVPYALKSGYSADKYFMTKLIPDSVYGATDKFTKMGDFLQTYANLYGANVPYLSAIGYTDPLMYSNDSTNGKTTPYRYAEYSWDKAAHQTAKDAKFNPYDGVSTYGTNMVSQNNAGIVTMYPFSIDTEFHIGPTHTQAYAADIESDDMTVWYSLAGGDNAKKANNNSNSSAFAADPRDGMDNYFVYSYGSVSFCASGHNKITGRYKYNNDERMLYINLIVNSVRKSVKQPEIIVYDYKDVTNDIIKYDNATNTYFTKVKETNQYVDFSFKVTVDPKANLNKVKIYYELDCTDPTKYTDYKPSPNNILIADWDTTNVQAGTIRDVFRYDADLEKQYDSSNHTIPVTYTDPDTGKEVTSNHTMLQLKPEYFEKYNNEYTYIVIEAIDSKGRTVHQRIKIKLSEILFKLT